MKHNFTHTPHLGLTLSVFLFQNLCCNISGPHSVTVNKPENQNHEHQ
jgi:hypothetical protein